jgi:uncharacterized membrane protein
MKLNKELILKSVIYRILAFIAMYFISLIFTKKMSISLMITIAELIIKAIAYYSYEHLWKWIKKTWTIKK